MNRYSNFYRDFCGIFIPYHNSHFTYDGNVTLYSLSVVVSLHYTEDYYHNDNEDSDSYYCSYNSCDDCL